MIMKYLTKALQNPGFATSIGLALLSAKLKLKKSLSVPTTYIIEGTNLCDQQCTICETGLKILKRKKGMMSPENFRIIADKVLPYAKDIGLYWMGESMLNKDIYLMVRYLKNKNPKVNVGLAVNGNVMDPEKLVLSGLDYVEFKFTGMDEKTHSHYRVGGSLEKIINYIKEIQAAKEKIGSETPKIGLGFIIMQHNEHQVEEFKKYAKEKLPIDKVILVNTTVRTIEQAKKMFPENKKYWAYKPEAFEKGILSPKGAPYPEDSCEIVYTSMSITWDGETSLCCRFCDNEFVTGNMLKQSFEKVWNGKRAQEFRSMVNSKNKPTYCFTKCHSHTIFPIKNKKKDMENKKVIAEKR